MAMVSLAGPGSSGGGSKRRRISERRAVASMTTIAEGQFKEDRDEHLAWVHSQCKADPTALGLCRAVIMRRIKADRRLTYLKRGVVSLGTVPTHMVRR